MLQSEGCARGQALTRLPLSPSNQITLLKYFRNYMSEHLLKAGANGHIGPSLLVGCLEILKLNGS